MKELSLHGQLRSKDAVLRFYFKESIKGHWHYMHMNFQRMKEIVSLCIDSAEPDTIEMIPKVYLPK
jgi:hypothetical protein